MSKKKSDDQAAISFEQAMEQLEKIIDGIESGEVGLEQSIAAYEQGAKLIGHCKQILDRAEQKISKLTVAELGDSADSKSPKE